MKVFRNNKVFVQKCDIANLMNIIAGLEMPVPNSVLMAVYKDGFVCSSESLYEFMELEGDDVIEFFRNLDYIVDYDELEGKSIEELTEFGISIEKEISALIDEFNSKDENYRKKHFNKASVECDVKRLKMMGVADYIHLLEGKLSFSIPSDGTTSIAPEKNGILKRVRSIFKKKD